MKLSCEIIQDLLPLFVDEVCSEQSRQAVAGHLRECEKCRKLMEDTHHIPELEILPEQPEADKAVAKSFKKIHRRWILSLIAVLLVIPVTLLGFLGYNQIRGSGICFSNFNEVIGAARFVNGLTSGNYGKAAGVLDFSGSYSEVQEVLAEGPEDYAPQFVEVTIGGEKWIAEEIFARNQLQDTSDAMQTWANLAYNGVFGALIPEAAWDELIEYEPELYREGADGTEILNGLTYHRLETAWGVFLVLEDVYDAIGEFGMAEAIYSPIVLLLPADVYLAAAPEVEALAEETWQDIQRRYACFAAMDLAQYTEYMRSEYADVLENLTLEGYSIGEKGFQSVCRSEKNWIVVYAVEVRCGSRSAVIYLDLECHGSQIKTVYMHYYDSGDMDWLDMLLSALCVG